MRVEIGRLVVRARRAIAWRVRGVVGKQRIERAVVAIARPWRAVLAGTTFVGITGSAGKTTTKDLLIGVLSRRWRGVGSFASMNELPGVAGAILRTRPTHGFCAVEMSEDAPGALERPLALVRPTIGIVTVIGNDHWSAFRSREAIAQEVEQLIQSLPATGTAVLNADDPLVVSMAERARARVILYGTSPDAGLRAEDVRAAWPDRLRMTLVHGEERIPLNTQLCGSHWLPAVLGAIGGGLAMGIPLGECAAGIAAVAPFDGRMQPVTTASGVTFIRDDYKAPLWTVDGCFEFMKAARARRKFIVIGTLSDRGSRGTEKYGSVAKRAQEVADVTIFVGDWASHVLKVRQPGKEDALRTFASVRDAASYIQVHAGEGDLVLLKGTNRQDHLYRIVLAYTGEIACWRDDCKLAVFCNVCPQRYGPVGPHVQTSIDAPGEASLPSASSPEMVMKLGEQVVVGLGNPDPKYAGTPHNVGYEVLDQLADSMALEWVASPEAWIARGSWEQQDVCLMKLRVAMNSSGVMLNRLAESLRFGPAQCILVHDDLDLPIGTVRARTSGGAGGHRGVASILGAFQTAAFRRVKVGVGRPGGIPNRVEYVLTAFDSASSEPVRSAIAAAQACVGDILGHCAANGNRRTGDAAPGARQDARD
jgi:UDP-N-acetylmuramoyl-tripeptide--D-alanyl-D-alanine ligase